MAYVKWAFIIIFWGTVAVILQYSLPQHDVVRIVNTYEERQDLNDWTRIFWSEPEDQSASLSNRDVQFIQAVRANGKPIVYRNEDTGWGWPFYFKFDSADLQAEAANLARGDEWAMITHYGWRVRWASIYPNAVSIRPVAGPDVNIIPWFNIFFFVFLGLAALFVRAMWRQFMERSVDPLIDKAEHQIDEVQAGVARGRGRIARWIGRK